MHMLGSSILLVDCYSNAAIVAGSEVRHRKEKIHSEQVSAVAVGPDGEVFATGSRDKTVKVWSKTLTLLHAIDVHKAKINAVLFFELSLMVFDLDAVISVHQLTLTAPSKLERKSAFKTPAPFVDAKYAKSKKKIYGVTNQAGGHINIVNIEKKRIEKILQTEKRIFAIEISSDEKMIFANVASS
jgi:WD40 repeat protein